MCCAFSARGFPLLLFLDATLKDLLLHNIQVGSGGNIQCGSKVQPRRLKAHSTATTTTRVVVKDAISKHEVPMC